MGKKECLLRASLVAGSPVNEQSLGAQTLRSGFGGCWKAAVSGCRGYSSERPGGGADGTFTPWEVLLPLPVGKTKGPTQS